MRGDDRPGSKKDTPAPAAARGGKWGDRKDGARPGRDDRGPRPDSRGGDRNGPGAGRDRATPWQEAPRLGDTAFRAQRDALENAQATLRKLAAQAHGEALTHLMTAWEKRDALTPAEDGEPRRAIVQLMNDLDRGTLRVAEKTGTGCRARPGNNHPGDKPAQRTTAVSAHSHAPQGGTAGHRY